MENLSPITDQNVEPEDARHLATYLPDLWGDSFLDYTPPDELVKTQMKQEIEELKDMIRKVLVDNDKNQKERLMYIDVILRLGVAYHFEEEIGANLLNYHDKHFIDDCHKDDLDYLSIRFRILRQFGFHVSCDVFAEKLKNEDGSFKEIDVKDLLSLYEASHFRVHGEDLLDEVFAYSKMRLTSFARDINCDMASHVTRALERPLFKRSPRLESRYQISSYGLDDLDPSHDDILLRLAKLDFNFLQSLHKEELRDITRWSKGLELTTKLLFTRDRLPESFFWSLGVYYESKYSQARIFVNKAFKLISIIDDMYDAYGKFQELQLFTVAIQRWDKSYLSGLPEYMKFVYELILDTFEDYENDLAEEGRSYVVNYLREQLKTVIHSYMEEAKWCHESYVPTFDEYMRNGIPSSAYLCMISASFLGMGDIANKDAFEWIDPSSKVVKGTCIIARILNDIASHKFEQERDHVASAMECYMQEFGVTEEVAYRKLLLIVEDAWRDVTEVMLENLPMPLTTCVLNITRILHDLYDVNEDGYTMNRLTEHKIIETLVTPIM